MVFFIKDMSKTAASMLTGSHQSPTFGYCTKGAATTAFRLWINRLRGYKEAKDDIVGWVSAFNATLTTKEELGWRSNASCWTLRACVYGQRIGFLFHPV